MSHENVEVVRAIYRAWERGESAAPYIHRDVEYVNPPYAVEPGTRRGRKSFARTGDVFTDLRIEPERYIDAGEDVVVIGVLRGRGAGGLMTEGRQGYVWTIRDGRAARFRWFNNPAEALEALGLSE